MHNMKGAYDQHYKIHVDQKKTRSPVQNSEQTGEGEGDYLYIYV